jgi:predicted  nucleic acid-binding Zn-ribbon protein
VLKTELKRVEDLKS